MAQLKIHNDGTIEAMLGTQDIGGGARTVMAIVLSKEFGYLSLEKIDVKIGDSEYPRSGTTMASSTSGQITDAVQRAARDMRDKFFKTIADGLGQKPEDLELREGPIIGVSGKKNPTWTWKEAAGKLKDTLVAYVDTRVEQGGLCFIQMPDGSLKQIRKFKDYYLYLDEQGAVT